MRRCPPFIPGELGAFLKCLCVWWKDVEKISWSENNGVIWKLRQYAAFTHFLFMKGFLSVSAWQFMYTLILFSSSTVPFPPPVCVWKAEEGWLLSGHQKCLYRLFSPIYQVDVEVFRRRKKRIWLGGSVNGKVGERFALLGWDHQCLKEIVRS